MTTHYDNMNNTCRKSIHSFECLKMSKQMKREKTQLTVFYFVVKVKSTQSTFVLSI